MKKHLVLGYWSEAKDALLILGATEHVRKSIETYPDAWRTALLSLDDPGVWLGNMGEAPWSRLIDAVGRDVQVLLDEHTAWSLAEPEGDELRALQAITIGWFGHEDEMVPLEVPEVLDAYQVLLSQGEVDVEGETDPASENALFHERLLTALGDAAPSGEYDTEALLQLVEARIRPGHRPGPPGGTPD